MQDIDYQCWLRYEKIDDDRRRAQCLAWCSSIVVPRESQVLRSAVDEMLYGLKHLLAQEPVVSSTPQQDRFVLLGRFGDSPLFDDAIDGGKRDGINQEGYIIN